VLSSTVVVLRSVLLPYGGSLCYIVSFCRCDCGAIPTARRFFLKCSNKYQVESISSRTLTLMVYVSLVSMATLPFVHAVMMLVLVEVGTRDRVLLDPCTAAVKQCLPSLCRRPSSAHEKHKLR